MQKTVSRAQQWSQQIQDNDNNSSHTLKMNVSKSRRIAISKLKWSRTINRQQKSHFRLSFACFRTHRNCQLYCT